MVNTRIRAAMRAGIIGRRTLTQARRGLYEQTQDKILRLLNPCVEVNLIHSFVSFSLMAISYCLMSFSKSSAKVLHFFDICK